MPPANGHKRCCNLDCMQITSSRREFLNSLASGVVASALPASAAPSRRPNILYILADDLGYGDLRCYNPASKVPTPNLDRFATQGVRFTDAHSPSAVCTPTRYGIMTGRYCWRSRLKTSVLNGYSPALIEPGRLTVPAMLKQQGYRTAGIGKWHLGLGNREPTDYSQPLRPGPLEAGFDSYYGIPASLDMPPYLYFENDRAVAQPTAHVDDTPDRRGVFWRGGAAAPGFRHIDVLPRLADKAVDYLRAGTPQPFYLYLALTAPHTPWLATPEFRGKSAAGEYGDFVAMVDGTVGRVLRLLDERKLTGDTLVVFASDNGAYWLPEDIARWPGRIHPGTTCAETTCLVDLMATLADLTGYRLPRDAAEDSWSMLPALLGERLDKPIREATVHHSSQGHFSLRQGPWKLNVGRGSGGFTPPVQYTPKPGEPEGELFNVAEDLAETRNLYQERPEIVARLKALLEKYQRQGYSRPL